MKTSTLKPGFLVSLKTSVRGNVSYLKETIDKERTDADGALREKWATERTVSMPDEHKRSIKARSAARACITGVCALSAFGYLCPEDKIDQLQLAIADANKIVEEFNATAWLSRISFFVIAGKVASNDAQAIKAISSEIRELMEEMSGAVSDLDVAEIRKAANKARNLGQMLDGRARERVQEAIDAARATASKIAKAGETAAIAIDTDTLRVLAEARTAFLDLEEAAPVASVTDDSGRGLDFEPADCEPATNVVTGEASRPLEFA